MKKCKFCMSEIDDKAKICPNCKKDLRDFANRHPIITFILFLFLFGSIISWLSENIKSTWSINNSNSGAIVQNPENSNWIWEVWYYTDDFWDKTNENVITNKEYIIWTFSNTATENSSLNVKFLIDNIDNISIKLFEYSQISPVKTLWNNTYKVSIKDKDWIVTNLTALNNSDRLKIDNSKKLYDILLKWWEVKFAINWDGSSYNFSFNSDWFENIINDKK